MFPASFLKIDIVMKKTKLVLAASILIGVPVMHGQTSVMLPSGMRNQPFAFKFDLKQE